MGGFNPWEKHARQIGSFPQTGMNIKYFAKAFSNRLLEPTPDPRPTVYFRNSFHLGVKGDVLGMLQGYVGFLSDS